MRHFHLSTPSDYKPRGWLARSSEGGPLAVDLKQARKKARLTGNESSHGEMDVNYIERSVFLAKNTPVSYTHLTLPTICSV